MPLAPVAAARQVVQGLVAAHQRHLLLGRHGADRLDDPVVIDVGGHAGGVDRIDQHHVDPVRADPGHGLAERAREGVGIDPGDGVVGADLPDHEIGLGLRHHGAQALGRPGGDLSRQAAMVDRHVGLRQRPFQGGFELGRVGGRGARRGTAADRQDPERTVLAERGPDRAQLGHGVELRARDPAFLRQAGLVTDARVGRLLRSRPRHQCPQDQRGQRPAGHGDARAPHDRARDDLVRLRHSTNHAVNPRPTRPLPATSISTSTPPPVWKRTSCPIRLRIEPMEKTAREFRPS